MSKNDIGMIRELGTNIESIAGKNISKKIMDGSENLTESSSKENIALFVSKVVCQLDSNVDEEKRIKIMEACGRNCASINRRVIESFKKRRNKYKDIETFLEAEQKKPMKGTRLEIGEKTIYQYYTPNAFTKPMRCYCSLLRGLPTDKLVSLTYCHCSKAFVQKLWESVLEKPVSVELLQSVVYGDSECKFAIHFS